MFCLQKHFGEFAHDEFMQKAKEPALFVALNGKSIAKLSMLLEDFDVQVHVFLRRQDLIFSWHKGRVMKGKRMSELNLLQDTHLLLYPNILENWERHFGKSSLNIHLYDESISGNAGIALMTSKMGLSGIYGGLTPNPSDIRDHKWKLSLQEVELFRQCARMLASSKDFPVFRDKFFAEYINPSSKNTWKKKIDHCLMENIKPIPIDANWLAGQISRNKDVCSKFEIDSNSSHLKDEFLTMDSRVKVASILNYTPISNLAQEIVDSFHNLQKK